MTRKNPYTMPLLKKVPDYTGNRSHAANLAQRLQDFYNAKGRTDVKVWVEYQTLPSGKLIYGTRSNIVYDLTKL